MREAAGNNSVSSPKESIEEDKDSSRNEEKKKKGIRIRNKHRGSTDISNKKRKKSDSLEDRYGHKRGKKSEPIRTEMAECEYEGRNSLARRMGSMI